MIKCVQSDKPNVAL